MRFHGPDALDAAVPRLVRRPPAAAVGRPARRAWLDDGRDVYAYFNNDWYGHAVTDATQLRDLLGGRNRTRVEESTALGASGT